MSKLDEFSVRLIKTDDCGITTIGFYLDRSERFEVISCRIGDHKVMVQPNDHGKFRFRLPFGRHTATLIARGPNDYLTIIKSFEVLDPQVELIRRIVREELAASKAEETDRRQQMLADIRARRPVDAFVKYEDDPNHQGNEPDEEPFAYAHPNGAIWRTDNYPAGMDFTKDGWFPLYRRGSER